MILPNHEEQRQIDERFAMWVFQSGLPSTTVESETFKDLIQAIRPSVTIPSRRRYPLLPIISKQ